MIRTPLFNNLRFLCIFSLVIQISSPVLSQVQQSKAKQSKVGALLRKINPFAVSSPSRSQATSRLQTAQFIRTFKQRKARQAISDALYPRVPIIEKTEWQELQLEWLLNTLDAAKTSFGGVLLREMLIPIADKNELARRQSITELFLADDELFKIVAASLDTIYQYEDSVLTYYGNDELTASASSMYYKILKLRIMKKIPGLPQLEKYLNNSRWALEAAMWFDMGKASLSLARVLCLNGLLNEAYLYSLGYRQELDVWEGLKNGLTEPIKQICWWKYDTCQVSDKNPLGYDPKDPRQFFRAMLEGNFADRVQAMQQGVTQTSKITFMGRSIFSLSENAYAPGKSPWYATVGGVTVASALAGIYYIKTSMDVADAGSRVKFLHTTMNKLHERLIDVARFFEALCKLNTSVQAKGGAAAELVAQLGIIFNEKASKELAELRSLLSSATFQDGQSFFYWRGKVLRAHTLMQKVLEELRPCFRALGELDAHYAIAALCRQHAAKPAQFTLANFVESETPIINFVDCWIPVLPAESVVKNNITFNVDGQAGKLIITGPNGGGKSTYLKTVGQALLLAHSWGIVPAASNTLSLCAGLRTCLHPQEDLQQGMSTFMAEKARMDEILAFIEGSNNQPITVLVDEPYRGTVDAEAADRIHGFGMRIAPYANCIACIATHNQKPTVLEADTNGVFANAQVQIEEIAQGKFKRTYTVKAGPANWWFEDAGKRSRFIDWLGARTKA